MNEAVAPGPEIHAQSSLDTCPLYHILWTLLHELAHAWQYEHGTPSKPPHHNKEFREKCKAFGVPTDEGGHDLGFRHGSPFEAYCRRHGVAFPSAPGPSATLAARVSRSRSFPCRRPSRRAASSRSGPARAA